MGGIDRKDTYLLIRKESGAAYGIKSCFAVFLMLLYLTALLFTAANTKSLIGSSGQLAETLLKTYRQIDLTSETRVISRTVGQTTTTVRQPNVMATLQSRPVVEGNHFLMHADVKRGRCWYCANVRKIISRTIWQCMECRVNLCILGCFRDYHKP